MAETALRLRPRRLAKRWRGHGRRGESEGRSWQTTPDQRLHGRSISLRPVDGVNSHRPLNGIPRPSSGAGRIDAIPSDVLAAVAAHQPAEIRGKVSRSPDGRVGRFGLVEGPDRQPQRVHPRRMCQRARPGGPRAFDRLPPAAGSTPEKAKGLDMATGVRSVTTWWLTFELCPAPVAIMIRSARRAAKASREGRRLFADVGCFRLPRPDRRQGPGDLAATCCCTTLGSEPGRFRELLRDRGTHLARSGDCPGVRALPAAVGLPRFRGHTSTTDGLRTSRRSVAAAQWSGSRVDAPVFRPLVHKIDSRSEAFLKDRWLRAPRRLAALGVMLCRRVGVRFRVGGRAHSRESSSGVDGRRLWPAARPQQHEEQERPVPRPSGGEARPRPFARSLGTWKRVARLTLRWHGVLRQDRSPSAPTRTRAVRATARKSLQSRRVPVILFFEDPSARWSPVIDG